MIVLLIACASSPNDAELTEQVQVALERRLSDYQVHSPMALQVQVDGPEGFSRTITLYDLKPVCVDQAACEPAVRELVERVGQETAARAEPARAADLRLRPVPLDAALPGSPSLTPSLALVTYFVSDRTARPATPQDLELIDSSPEEARALARTNTRLAAKELRIEGGRLRVNGVMPIDTLLVPELWSEPMTVWIAGPEEVHVGEAEDLVAMITAWSDTEQAMTRSVVGIDGEAWTELVRVPTPEPPE